ncbi:hypothetical protein PVT71_02360 [Salipiger sp. H15]|uniref:DUF4157 domain-containing protein n=1 Tax=Alloyangia sp. H15 TaxID=3029062 RepID=A0AAU8AGJ6_9RHOB
MTTLRSMLIYFVLSASVLFPTISHADFWSKARRVVDPGGAIIQDIIEGKKPDEAVKDTADVIVETHKDAVEAVVETGGKIDAATVEFVRQNIGDDFANALSIAQMPDAIGRALTITVTQQASDVVLGNKSLGETFQEAVGIPLAAALRQAHDALSPRAKPLPDDIKTALYAGFSHELVDRARYVETDVEGNLPAIINTLKTKIGETDGTNHAVTVDDIIAFETVPSVLDIGFWAHELIHVRQYRDWGIDKFAAQYATNYKSVENEAEAGSAVFIDALKKARELAELREKLK